MKIKIFLSILLLPVIIYAESAKVTFLKGKVNVKEGIGKFKKIKKGDSIPEGAKIVTGNGSMVTLFYNGSEFKIMQNSKMVLNSLPGKDKEGKVEISKGFAWFKIENAKKNGFTAVTPTSAAGVRGTAFATMYEPKPKMAMNCICHGKVEVSDKNSNSLMVEKGYGSAVSEKGVEKTEYVKDFKDNEVLPSFKDKIKKAPILKNCLSCHKTKGWSLKGVVKDNAYGK
ncbi:MAG: FecR domain-containing protein [Leptospiraceae bacterium]|nr:FecR domain-containing protein [Leptospiraceae bacterium]